VLGRLITWAVCLTNLNFLSIRVARLPLAAMIIYSMVSNQLLANDVILSDVEQLQWDNRIILALADRQSEAEVMSQLYHAKSEIDERNLLWFVINAEQLMSNYEGEISKNFARDIHEKYLTNAVISVLIGKDGSVKDRQTVFSLNSMLLLIDSMPMRQTEMMRDKD
jgi:uncharacterized protein YabN with tetrapyrrole methylase and pyrophosphatase domain